MTSVESESQLVVAATPEQPSTAAQGQPRADDCESLTAGRRWRTLDYWRSPWTSLLGVAMTALLLRGVLYGMSSRPFFMTDSGSYLDVAHRFHLPHDRPIGVSLFYNLLFRVWHDLRMLVIGQALLGVGSAVLAVLVARRVGVLGRYAIVVGLAVALSPTLLVYERTMLAETLVVFLTLLATALFLSALGTGKFGRAIVAGVVVGTIATVRTNNAVLGVGLVLLAVASGFTTRAWTRAGLVAALLFGAAIPVLAYGSLNFVSSRAESGDGTFALSYFDGVSLFSRLAPLTDCSEPSRPPAMRAEVCAAGDAYLNSGVAAIIWDPGPVNSALGSPDIGTTNAELRELALENARNHPTAVLRDGLTTAWQDLTAQDFRYKPRANQAGHAGNVVERYFGLADASVGSPTFSNGLQNIYGGWVRVRPLLWAALAIVLVLGLFRRWRLNGAALLAFGLFLVPVGVVALAGAPGPRYVVPYEFVGFVAAAWLAHVLEIWWLRRRESNDADDDGPSNFGTPRLGADLGVRLEPLPLPVDQPRMACPTSCQPNGLAGRARNWKSGRKARIARDALAVRAVIATG